MRLSAIRQFLLEDDVLEGEERDVLLKLVAIAQEAKKVCRILGAYTTVRHIGATLEEMIEDLETP